MRETWVHPVTGASEAPPEWIARWRFRLIALVVLALGVVIVIVAYHYASGAGSGSSIHGITRAAGLPLQHLGRYGDDGLRP